VAVSRNVENRQGGSGMLPLPRQMMIIRLSMKFGDVVGAYEQKRRKFDLV